MSLEAAILAKLNQGGASQTIDELLAKLPAIDSGTLADTSTSDLDQLNILFGSAAGMAMVAASTTAMNAVIASTTAMNAVIASTTAMNAVAASTTAMNALVAASTTFGWSGSGWNAAGAEQTIITAHGLLTRVTGLDTNSLIYINHASIGYANFSPPLPREFTTSLGFRAYNGPVTVSYIPL